MRKRQISISDLIMRNGYKCKLYRLVSKVVIIVNLIKWYTKILVRLQNSFLRTMQVLIYVLRIP